MKPKVYIFRGAPASGKGTIVPEFAKQLSKPVTLIEQDKLRWGFHLIGRDIKDVSEEEHHLAFENTVLIYEQYLKRRKYNIVLEGLFTWDDKNASQGSVKQITELAERFGAAWTSIVLKADKEELLERNAAREYAVPPDEFNALYDKIYEKIDPLEILIDSTGKSPDETLKELSLKIVE